LASAVVVLAWSGAELAAQMGTGRVAGSVKDEAGKPIAGVKVMATPAGGGNPLEATTNDKGEWGILGFRNGRYEFSFTAEGYREERLGAPVQQLGRNPRMDVVLQKLQKGTAAGGAASGLLAEGNALYEQKKYAEAIAKFQELLAQTPTLYQVNLNIGNAYRASGDIDKAMAAYQLVLAEDPSHLGALIGMGESSIKKNELEKAAEFFEKAVTQAPEDEALAFNVAEVYFNTGNAPKALEYYQKASALKPDWVDPVYKVGLCYVNQMDIAQAKVQMEKVIAMAPDSPQAAMAKGLLDSLK
jgi:tetratricopeptide (TPR) repeat protein